MDLYRVEWCHVDPFVQRFVTARIFRTEIKVIFVLSLRLDAHPQNFIARDSV